MNEFYVIAEQEQTTVMPPRGKHLELGDANGVASKQYKYYKTNS